MARYFLHSKMSNMAFVVLIIILCASTVLCKPRAQLRNDVLANATVHLQPEYQTNVTTKLILTSLNKLDTVNQELSTTFQLHLEWIHPNLTWPAAVDEPSELVFYVNEVWTPPLVVSNAVEDALFLLQDDIVPLRVTNKGKVTWVPRLSPRTTCEINIANFPADKQVCRINITSWGYVTDEINLIKDGSGVVLDLYNDMAWHLYNADAKQNSRVYTADMEFSNIEFSFYFKREVKFYEYILVAPFCCIVFLMILVFLIPSDHQTEKIIYSVTLFVAFQMFLNLLPSLLPPVFNKEGPNVFGDYIFGVTIFGTATTTILFVELFCIHVRHIYLTLRGKKSEDTATTDTPQKVKCGCGCCPAVLCEHVKLSGDKPLAPYGVNIGLFLLFLLIFVIGTGLLHKPL